ncbi:acyltransferase domain-containing protein [Micromonospora sp. R77]|uniref:acyltransferase domain-containing protein n=1 Tax=Micromonospora sp. R77 TaxID=2925836 RepID=UPI001F60230B|nr:acyltransferase domain-containing protein [Micromonospora sp. R77]MCI4066744.1 acyltransferase domain-containing protein [Micromonospora sp. R77]
MTETSPTTTTVGGAPTAAPSSYRPDRLVFLFPGRAAAATGMGRGAYAAPVVRAGIDTTLAALDGALAGRVHAVLFGPPGGPVPPDAADPALFVLEHALTRLLTDAGLAPDTVLGYGVGEVTAACAAGVLDPADALRLAVGYGRLAADLPPTATMSVGLPPAEVTRQLPPGVRLVAVDTPESCVVAGPEPELRRWERDLAQLYVTCHRPPTPVAGHPDDVPSRLAPVAGALVGVAPRTPRIRWLSSVSGRPVSADEAVDREHWLRQPLHPVRFADAAGQLRAGDRLVEVGPGGTLTGLLRQSNPDLPARAVLPTDAEGRPPSHPDPVRAVRALLAARRDSPHLPDQTEAGVPRPGRRR